MQTHLEKLHSLLNMKPKPVDYIARRGSRQGEFVLVIDDAINKIPELKAMIKSQPDLYNKLINFAEDRLNLLLKNEEANNENIRANTLTPIVNQIRKFTMSGHSDRAKTF